MVNLVLERRKALKRLFSTLQPLPRMPIYRLLRGRRPSEVLVLTLRQCRPLGFLERCNQKEATMDHPRQETYHT